MNGSLTVTAAAVAAGFALVVTAASSAAAAPSCVAQSVQAEHAINGTAWGHDLIAFLASNREVLQEFGFQHFGDLASFAAAQDRAACPPDL